MDFQYTLFVILAPLSALAAIATLLYARRYRASAASEISALSGLVVAAVGWLFFNTLELVASSEGATVLWAKVSYPFIAATPVAWLALALQYVGKKRWMVPSRFVFFCVIPAITAVLALTNSWHSLLWQEYEFVPVNRLLYMKVVAYGPWFWVHVLYGYALVLLGTLLISRQYFRSFSLYRQQSAWVIIGSLIPVLTNIVYVLDVVPGLQKDYTSVSFALAGVAFAIGIVRYHLFDLRPVACDVVIANMVDAMLTLDGQDRIVDLNPAARRLIAAAGGRVSERAIGLPVAQVLDFWPSLAEHFRDGDDVQTDIPLELEGVRRTYDVRISLLTNRRGTLAGRLIVLHDVTERKRVEETIRQYAHELEAQNEELDAFAHTVAHDLKNPLFTLIGYSEYVENNLQTMSDTEIVKCLAGISQSGYLMANIVNELLLLARVRKQDEVELLPLDMRAIVARVQDRFAANAAQFGADVVAPTSWPVVMGHAPWVEEVWANYLSNALKYGGRPEEEVPPHVALGFDESGPPELPDTHVRFWVHDNGLGLTEAEQSQLFAEFTRLTETRAEGHGLGLAIVRRIMERLDGYLGVESEVGQGCTFWFSLPRKKNNRSDE